MYHCPHCHRQIDERGLAQHERSQVCVAGQSELRQQARGWVQVGNYLARARRLRLPLERSLGLGGAGDYHRARVRWWTVAWAFDLLRYVADDEAVRAAAQRGPLAARRLSAAGVLMGRRCPR